MKPCGKQKDGENEIIVAVEGNGINRSSAVAVALKRQKNRRKALENLQGILFASSPLVGFLLFGCIPLIISLILSFGKLRTFDLHDMEFIGFDNYVRIFTEDDKFLKSVGNTFVYAIFTVVLSNSKYHAH